MLRMALVSAVLLAATALSGASASEKAVPAVVQFNRDVVPVMSNTCFKCHGPDIKANKTDLRLDLPENAVRERTDKTGQRHTPIVPGHPEASEVWRRVSSLDPLVVMPPPDSLHILSSRDKEIVRLWILQGAKYEAHWSYIAPRKWDPPDVGKLVRDPVDAFVLKELADRGIAPSPEADRRTLIRRLSLDLLGLPPSTSEVEAFVADAQPDAYERLVDRLLASPHYGERMAVGWLDLARFADTVGFHGDQRFNNFPFRDYVIDAFNANMPFDEFTREQLAGDLLPNATEAQRVASGFNRLNMVTREGGAQIREYLAKYAADRVRTVSTVWLGSTMACCECHDHKFDPYKTRDFYAMEAYFSDVKQWGVYADYDYSREPELKGFTNDFPFPPEIEVASSYLKARLARLAARNEARTTALAKAMAADPASGGALRDWVRMSAPSVAADAGGWTVLSIATATGMHKVGSSANKNGVVSILPDQSARLEFVKDKNTNRNGDGAILTLVATPGPVATLRVEAIPDAMFGDRVTNANGGGFFANEDSFSLRIGLEVIRAGGMKTEPVKLIDAYPDQRTNSYINGQIATSVIGEWRSAPDLVHERQTAVYVLAEPLVLGAGDRLVATLNSEEIARVRLSVSPLGVGGAQAPANVVAAAFGAKEPTQAQTELLASEFFRATGAFHPAEFALMLRDVREMAACRGGRAFTTVTEATTPAEIRVLHRGDWQDESGAVVAPSPPAFLNGGREADGPRQTRLDLANWLVSRNNPLTARAFMNRLWKQFFGTGLSAVVDDLGIQGEYPSHPELLDWLAVQFMDSGWDVKAMVRTIVTSSTYRQSSTFRPELADVDPNNRLLARQSPRRLEAEFVRDNALSAAGLVNLDVGGPSVYPYQPEGYYAALQFPDREYVADTDERQYRRGVYIHWQRTFLHPMLANFDAPSREECTASRVVSSTPQQALTLLNDPTFVEAARGLAEEALARSGSDFTAELDDAFGRLLSRQPDLKERKSLEEFYEGQLAYYKGKPEEAKKAIAVGMHPVPAGDDPSRLAAWMSVARVLINLNETIVRY